ncbi:MAG: VTT domain-containing protein [Puniceicoccales bacterium]
MKKGLRTAILVGIAMVLLLATVLLWMPESLFEEGWRIGQELWSELGNHPVLLYALIVILPAFPIPQTPFLILAGMVYSEPLGGVLGAAVAASAVGLNILWSYFLTVGPLHALAEKFLSRFGYSVPKIPAEDHLKFSFLVRVTPVFPLCVQNYLLGLLKVPLHFYLLASWTTQVPLAFAVAFTAGAILEGNLIVVLVAVGVLLFLVIGLKWLRRRLGRDPELKGVEEEMGVEEPVES